MASSSDADMLARLPTALLDELVSDILHVAPSLRPTFLSSLGSRIHASAVRISFCVLVVPDDARLFEGATRPGSPRSAVSPLLANPDRYALAVKELVVSEPDASDMVAAKHTEQGGLAVDLRRPLDSKDVSRILEACSQLEKLTWASSFVPPDGLCETLVAHNPRLARFSFFPIPGSAHSSPRLMGGKWDCPSLPLLSTLPVTSLRLSRLSQAGARSLSDLLTNMGEYSTLEELSIDFVWLDDQLCEKIVGAGGKLQQLRIGTIGTKLTDKGVITLIEGCGALTALTLDEVQGRLSRALWTKPIAYPPNLKHFRIIVSENGLHHSWTKDHLLSLHAVPFASLTTLSVIRLEMHPRIENNSPIYDAVVDDVLALKPVPKEFVDKLRTAKSLTCLECDWWAWTISDLKVVLESCPNLERLKICLDAPFAKVMGLTSSFAPLTSLQTLSVSINPFHAPGRPPVPLLPFSRPALPTPRESPVMKAKSVLPQLLDFDQMQTQTCLSKDTADDPSMPLLRDVKRFVRRCLKLSLLEWYGKAGRGSWLISRAQTTSKISVNVSVKYVPPTISNEIWQAVTRDRHLERLVNAGWNLVRDGQSWTGDGAKAFEAERLADKDWEDRDSVEKDRPCRARDAVKARLSSISTSSSCTSGTSDSPHANQLPTPTKSVQLYNSSPEQELSPLTPAYPESPTASHVGTLSSVDENGLGWPVTSTNRSGRAMKGRTRSMNALGSQVRRETQSERSGNGSQTNGIAHGAFGGGSSSQKPGRGKGRVASSESGAAPSTNGTGRGRNSRNHEERRKNSRTLM